MIASGKIPEAAMFARAYLPSKLTEVMEIWRQKVEDKPYVPTSLNDIPENLSTIDLAMRVETALKEYYDQPNPSGSEYEAAYSRHFSEISQQVETGIEHELQKPLFQAQPPSDPSPASEEPPAEPQAEPQEEEIPPPEQPEEIDV